MTKGKKRVKVTELTPEVLNTLDQEALIAMIMRLYEQNKQLSEYLQSLVQEKYGRKNERFEDPNQLRILSEETEESTQQEIAKSPDAPGTGSSANRPKQPGHTRNPMPSFLKHERIERQPNAEEQICKCGAHRIKVNEVIRNSRYEIVPVRFYVEDIIDAVWECPACNDAVVVAAEAFEPIPNGKAGPRLLFKIAEDRWLNHLPYHRQEQIFARESINISRSTMCEWMATLAKIYSPLYKGMKDELLKSKIISTDDTTVKVLDRTKKTNIKRGHEWIFRGDDNNPVNVFHYTPGRGRDGPKNFIPGFRGYLQGDCFSGNQALCTELGATLVACLAHARRYFKKAESNNKARCDEALKMFQDLFEIEETARSLKLSSKQIILMRQQEAIPILTKLKSWLDEQVITALPQSSFGKAVTYCLNNWEVLNNYLLDGNLRIDNNLAEQQMKLVAIGRKNWYFFGNDDAGEVASILLTLLSTCLRHDVEPKAYLYDITQKLITNPHCNIQELFPHNWKLRSIPAEILHVNATPKVASSHP